MATNMDYNTFSRLHGGRRTKALAGHFRELTGGTTTPAMQAAMQQEAMRRARAQGGFVKPEQTNDMAPILPAAPDAPPAPKLGGRTKPGTTPAKKGLREAILRIGGAYGEPQQPNQPQLDPAVIIGRLAKRRILE